MFRNLWIRLVVILLIAGLAIWIDTSNELKITNPFDGSVLFQRDVSPRLGLDLQGGLQVLLEADLPADADINEADMEVARMIMENRTNALGVSENLLQVAGERRIIGEFPGLQDAESVLAIIQQTGLLEFVDTGDFSPPTGTIIRTNLVTESELQEEDNGLPVFNTIMTGRQLRSAQVGRGDLGQIFIEFTLTPEGADIFGTHTAANTGKHLTIVLDKEVISSPVIESAIIGGSGVITGQFTLEEANAFAVQLRYGSLPIPLKIVETRIVGPTLGEDSLQKSLIAGAIGMVIVMLFLALYYRLSGLVAIVALLFYGTVALALFKYIPVTLTLAGIAGFLLSTGSALDANILIFERIKEELRNGKTLIQARELGWGRALSAILDANTATLITAAILWWFGSSFGATIVKGFSLVLALGVGISLFTSLFVTRTLFTLLTNYYQPKNFERWFGI